MTRQVFINIPQTHSHLDVLCKDSTRKPMMNVIESELQSEFPSYDIDVQPAYSKNENLIDIHMCESDEKINDKAWFTLKDCIFNAADRMVSANMELAEVSNNYYE